MTIWLVQAFSTRYGNLRFYFLKVPSEKDIEKAFQEWIGETGMNDGLVSMKERLMRANPVEVTVIDNR